MTDHVAIKGNFLYHQVAGSRTWTTFDLTKLVVVGEFTTEHGPFDDDHFISLAAYDKTTLDFPVNCRGYGEAIHDIACRTQLPDFERRVKLSSVKFESRVIWPLNLEGHSLYQWKKSDRKIFGFQVPILFSLDRLLCDSVQEYIAGKENKRCQEPF